jgi:hypothetical protein
MTTCAARTAGQDHGHDHDLTAGDHVGMTVRGVGMTPLPRGQDHGTARRHDRTWHVGNYVGTVRGSTTYVAPPTTLAGPTPTRGSTTSAAGRTTLPPPRSNPHARQRGRPYHTRTTRAKPGTSPSVDGPTTLVRAVPNRTLDNNVAGPTTLAAPMPNRACDNNMDGPTTLPPPAPNRCHHKRKQHKCATNICAVSAQVCYAQVCYHRTSVLAQVCYSSTSVRRTPVLFQHTCATADRPRVRCQAHDRGHPAGAVHKLSPSFLRWGHFGVKRVLGLGCGLFSGDFCSPDFFQSWSSRRTAGMQSSV